MPAARIYHLNQYSIPELLQLLHSERGEKIRLEVGAQSSLVIKEQGYEIEGPALDEKSAEQLLRTVTDSRQMRAFREGSTLDIIHTFESAKFLICAVQAFGTFSVELHTIAV